MERRLKNQRKRLREDFKKDLSTQIRRRSKQIGKMAVSEALPAYLADQLMSGDVVVDCGANVGAFLRHFVDTEARVFAFEPNPDCVALLNEKFGPNDGFSIIEKAVDVRAGTALLRLLPRYDKALSIEEGMNLNCSLGSSLLDQSKFKPGHGYEVEVVDFIAFLKNLISEHGQIAILKIDVEGTELEIMEELYKQDLFSSIKYCFIETHERFFPELYDRFMDIREKISAKYKPTHVNLEWV